MAELTYLNEASVVHNLFTRYMSDMIYVRVYTGFLNIFMDINHNFSDLFRSLLGCGQPLQGSCDIRP